MRRSRPSGPAWRKTVMTGLSLSTASGAGEYFRQRILMAARCFRAGKMLGISATRRRHSRTRPRRIPVRYNRASRSVDSHPAGCGGSHSHVPASSSRRVTRGALMELKEHTAPGWCGDTSTGCPPGAGRRAGRSCLSNTVAAPHPVDDGPHPSIRHRRSRAPAPPPGPSRPRPGSSGGAGPTGPACASDSRP